MTTFCFCQRLYVLSKLFNLSADKGKTILHNQDEDQQYGVKEAEPLLVRQHGEKLSATGKSSHKNSKKEPHTVKRFNEENSGKNQASSEYVLHLEKDSKTTEVALNQKHMETNKLNKDISNKFKKGTDVLEVFRVEKDLLVKFLRNLDVGRKNFHKASQNKARLTKSGSFPLTASSQMRKVSSSTFKHKENEIWAFPKGEKLLAGTQAPKMSASSFVKDISYEKPMHLVSDLGADSAMEQKPSISSRSSQGLTHKGWNQLVLHQFKVIKQKIKHALVEFKKSAYQTSVEAIHHTDSPEDSIPNNEKEVSQSLDDGMIQEYRNNKSSNETEASDYDSNKHEVPLMRRTSSLNESLDRYTQLFEKSFRKEVKWQSSKSKSLKLSNENKFSRSNLSLPNLEFLGFILHEALSDTNDTVETENQVHRKSVSLHLKTDKSPDQFKEAEIAEIVEGSDTIVNPSPLSDKVEEKIDEGVTYDQREDIYEPAVGDGSFPQEKEEISMTTYLSKEVMASVETSCEDNTSSHAEAATEIIGDCFGQIIPGGELNTQDSTFDELEADLPNGGSVYSLPDSLSNTNASVAVEGTNKSDDNHFLLFKSDADNGSNFKYVKDILEFSGFMGNENIQMPYTVDQPIKPSLFMDLDASLSNEIKSSEEEIINPYDHQLIFNLVNEVLLEIYERSPTYFPRPFSFNHRLHPMPKGNYLLNQVWTSVNSYLSLRPELDQTLDDVVGRDLAKRSGWMNLQHEEECVALELEEMIIDDLLDEIIF
ncbi:protein TRM32-like [Gastrolobium bilobum]|uniref:protein TRM32-like n=1 Tax=Gastrolobium bilobum TaxID=150636 RepID=UPI002AAF7D83|nr:protein TRM32-like [Gastrolobium bilobum]